MKVTGVVACIMQRTSFDTSACPVARALDYVGDPWSLMLLRDALQGLTRFDHFQKSLGIAPNILKRRLTYLVEAGIFERRPYIERPLRHEYVLTEKGRDFFPVIMSLFAWGSRHIPQSELGYTLGNPTSGEQRTSKLVDAATGEELTPQNTCLLPGKRADEAIIERIAHVNALRTNEL